MPSFHQLRTVGSCFARMTILRSTLWRQPAIIRNMLRHFRKQETVPALYNAPVFVLRRRRQTASYCVVVDMGAHLRLMDVFTFPRFRRRGIASELIAHVLSAATKPVYLTCPAQVAGFYRQLGFRETSRPPALLRFRLFWINTFAPLLLGCRSTAMIYRPSLPTVFAGTTTRTTLCEPKEERV